MRITEVRVKGEAEHQVVPREELGRLLEAGQVDGVFKYGLAARDEPQGEVKAVHTLDYAGLKSDRPTASSVITSANVDRDGDVVQTGGMLVEHYLKNPVVLPMHMHDFPVGLAEKLKVLKNSAWAQWQWLVDLPDSLAAKYQAWWDANAINATSIGFLPIKWGPTKEGYEGWVYEEWELLEFSPVVIPSNRDAVRSLEAFGEMVMAGPSPVMKSLWVAGESQGRPKQVAVPSTTFKDERGNTVTITIGENLVKIEDEPGDDGMSATADKGVITYARAHPDGTPKADPGTEWDNGKERAPADIDDLKVMCAWVDSEEPDNKGSYKFAHHHQDGKAVNKRACSAAIGVLNGGRGGTNIPEGDRKGVYAHVRKHLVDDFGVDPDDVPELKDAKGLASLDEIRLAHVAGALTADEAYEEIEGLVAGLEIELRSAVEAEAKAIEAAEMWRGRARELAAKVIRSKGGQAFGGERDGPRAVDD